MGDIVRLQHIHKWVGAGDGKTEILKDVSLVLQSGEFVAIMGASGSGKSTLLNILGLLDVPSSGSVELMGKEAFQLTDDARADLRAQTIGFIFQSFNLLSYLTARENVELPMTYHRRSDAPGRAHDLLIQMKLEHRTHAYPATLSGGERQRVAIARALANEPALILADEPTGALDSRTGTEIMELISGLHRRGTTVVLVTHDETVGRRAQRILQMKDGRFA